MMGLDLSTKCGIAVVGENQRVIAAQEVEFPKLRELERCMAIADYIMAEHAEHKPNLVVIEGYGYANAYTLATLVEIGTAVRIALWLASAHFMLVPPNSLKKFVTGKGNAAKDLMILALYKKWGFSAETNNIADAVALAMFGACSMDPNGFQKAQVDVVNELWAPKSSVQSN